MKNCIVINYTGRTGVRLTLLKWLERLLTGESE